MRKPRVPETQPLAQGHTVTKESWRLTLALYRPPMLPLLLLVLIFLCPSHSDQLPFSGEQTLSLQLEETSCSTPRVSGPPWEETSSPSFYRKRRKRAAAGGNEIRQQRAHPEMEGLGTSGSIREAQHPSLIFFSPKKDTGALSIMLHPSPTVQTQRGLNDKMAGGDC